MHHQARLIAFYLPQYHPIPENNQWWEPGFTEWTNVTKALPLFKGHYQPDLPSELGFYDLRVPETRERQAILARDYGIEAFCYWHYWFGKGRRLLDGPLNAVLASGKPDFPFCLAWANETWTGRWHGCNDRILMEQTYPGPQDVIDHFQALLPAFSDNRYLRVNGGLLFLIYKPFELPDADFFCTTWRTLAAKAGIGDFHFVAITESPSPPSLSWPNAWSENSPNNLVQAIRAPGSRKGFRKLRRYRYQEMPYYFSKIFGIPIKYDYSVAAQNLFNQPAPDRMYPMVLPNWDNTPRCGTRGVVFHNTSPHNYGHLLRKAIHSISQRPREDRIILIKSWNEWAEGNHLEPCRRYGRGYLEETAKALAAIGAD